MSSSIRWGFLGAGGIAAAFVEDLKLLPDAEVVAVGARQLAGPKRSPPSTACAGRYAVVRRAGHRPRRRRRLRLDHPPDAPRRGHARDRGRQGGAAREAVHDGRRPGLRRWWPPPGPAASSSWRRCGPGSCRTWCGSASCSPRARWATCGSSSPTTASGSPATRTTGCSHPSSAAAPCSTSASTRCPSPRWCSGRRPGSRRSATPRSPVSTRRPRCCCSTTAGRTRCSPRRSRPLGPNRAAIVGTEARLEIDSVFYTPTSFTLTRRDGSVERFDEPHEGQGLRHEAAEVMACLRAGRLESEAHAAGRDGRDHGDDGRGAPADRADLPGLTCGSEPNADSTATVSGPSRARS